MLEHKLHILSFITLLAPLASFLLLCFISPRYGKALSFLASVSIFISLITSAILLVNYWNTTDHIIQVDWFTIGANSFTADLALSNRSVIMLFVVSCVSFLVHLFSIGYMADDSHRKRYFAMLGFFTFSMQGIVLSDNLLQLFVFWELVGFSSYMLIGHYTVKPEAGQAAKKAFIMNRIGDVGFLVGLMIVWTTYETFSLTAILPTPDNALWPTTAALCIFCGVIAKSAQFPLFTWLPDAMEGPTPVSALIHAATMVAAGVYLLVRLFNLFTEDALLVVAITGMITTLIGALAALSQYDVKKILAYSTMSQLGLMILAIGMGVLDAALLHLLTHAFFKACLFLAAGLVIHSLHHAQPTNIHFDVQDIRNMGGLRKALPTAFFSFLIGGASLAGIPFFSGFLSKEAIMTALFMHNNMLSWFMLVVTLTVSFLTVLYTFRMVWFIFQGESRAVNKLTITEPPLIMRLPVVLLALSSLWFIVSWNPFDFKGWIMANDSQLPASLWITIMSVVWVCAALLLSWYIFRKPRFRTSDFLRSAFYVDKGYQHVFPTAIATSSRIAAHIDRKWIDKSLHALAYGQVMFAHLIGWIDRVFIDGTVNGVARVTGMGGKFTRSFQGGNIQLYIFWAIFAIIIFIIWLVK